MGAAAFNVTVAGEDVPAAIEVEATVTELTAVAVLVLEVLGLLVPLALPLATLPDAAGEPGEPENAPFGAAPQPIKIANQQSVATAIPLASALAQRILPMTVP